MKQNKRQIGAEYEEAAVSFLKKQGVKIIVQNYRCKQGEIDIIGYHDNYLVFFEVKYRSSKSCGNSTEAVGYYKQKIICKVANVYRYLNRIGDHKAIRYDVIAIDGTKIKWYQNAFYHIQR